MEKNLQYIQQNLEHIKAFKWFITDIGNTKWEQEFHIFYAPGKSHLEIAKENNIDTDVIIGGGYVFYDDSNKNNLEVFLFGVAPEIGTVPCRSFYDCDSNVCATKVASLIDKWNEVTGNSFGSRARDDNDMFEVLFTRANPEDIISEDYKNPESVGFYYFD